MDRIYRSLCGRASQIRERVLDIERTAPKKPRWEVRYESEGAISDLWQVWCAFARAFTIKRSTGTTSRSGRVVHPRTGDNRKIRILYEAAACANNNPPKPLSTITERRKEPTWGDVSKLPKILSGLGCADAPSLEAAINSNSGTLGHLQVVRNACAHRSLQALHAVRGLQIYYVIRTPIRHPIDLAWQDHAATHAPGLLKWISDIESLADILTTIP